MKWFNDSVSVMTLSNGFTLINDHVRDSNAMSGIITVGGGSHHDPKDKMGLAHFSEHMMSNGVPGKNFNAFTLDMADFGMTLENGNFNLMTSGDQTIYFANGTPDGVEYALEHYARAICEAGYTPELRDIEEGRIINEMTNGLGNADKLTRNFLNRARYKENILSRWTGGIPEHFPRIGIKDIRDHHAKIHAGTNMVLTISGPWTHEQAYKWANDRFSSLPQGEKLPRIIGEYNPDDIRATVPWVASQTAMTFFSDLGNKTTFNKYALYILTKAFSFDFKILADKMKLYGMGMSIRSENPKTSEVAVAFSIAPEQVRDMTKACVDTILNKRAAMTEADFELHKKRYLASEKLLAAFNTSDIRIRAGILDRDHFENYPTSMNEFEERVQAATYRDAIQILDRVCSSAIATCCLGIQRPDLPTGAQIERMLQGLPELEISKPAVTVAKPTLLRRLKAGLHLK